MKGTALQQGQAGLALGPANQEKERSVSSSRVDLIFSGVELRKKDHRRLLAARVNELISEAIQETIRGQAEFRIHERLRHDDETKTLQAEIRRLHLAIRTAQDRHFEDIREFARTGGVRSLLTDGAGQAEIGKAARA